MRILVTGADGLIGGCFLKLHKDRFEEIYTLSRTPKTDCQFTDIIYELGSGEPLELPDVDLVVHFAAQTSNIFDESTFLDDFKINSVGTGELLQACLKLRRRPFFIYIGTATQLGYTNRLYKTPELPDDNPTTLYDLGKLAGEHLLFNLIQNGSIKGCSLRLCNVFGNMASELKPDRGVLDKVYQKCLKGEKVEVLGNGKFYRDYVHVEDVADAINSTINVRSEVNKKKYYLGSGQAVFVRTAFEIIRSKAFKETGYFSKICKTEIPVDINLIHLRHFQADLREFSEISGWRPKKSLHDSFTKKGSEGF